MIKNPLEAGTFEKVLDDHKGLILRFCLIYTANDEDKKDLFQDILFNVWKSLGSFRGESAMSTWIYKIALRVALDYSKKNKRRSISKEHFIEFVYQTDFSKELEQQEQLDLLQECISGLNEIDKLLVTLYLEELPYKEIGSILGISENLVAVKMKRVKEKLYQCLNIKNNETK